MRKEVDGRSILEKKPGITITYKSKDGLDWEFSKQEGGTLYASQDGTVEGFWVANKLDNKLLFKTIVETYGEPTLCENIPKIAVSLKKRILGSSARRKYI